jgi:23S rRNA (cytidine1920-2'-O)/16S rRNA (cytidine1409-2'-O)-methyltransferase
VSFRLDQALVARGIVSSREKAQRLILAGQVRVNGQQAKKSSDKVKETDDLALDQPEKFVSRGGQKLEHGLEHFKVNVSGLVAVDVGASTGGFTDCLLQRGAAKVYAVDVGHGQLAWKLRQDSRVVVMEKTNARGLLQTHFSADSIPGIAAIDCSFISLRKILPPVVALLGPPGTIVALIKPQFEAGKEEADKGAGVISDASIHARVLEELKTFVEQSGGLAWRGSTESPLLGPAGNKEFLAHIEKLA